jgi:hypothetical protein
MERHFYRDRISCDAKSLCCFSLALIMNFNYEREGNKMSTREIKTNAATQVQENRMEKNKKAKMSQMKTTKGDIDRFDRGAYNFIKKQFKLTENEVLHMKQAQCPAKVNGAAANLFRFIDPDKVTEKGITINDYESLDQFPELIVYEGYRVIGKGGETIFKKRDSSGISFLEEKFKKGEITEIGIIPEKTASQKWLGRIGNFMMMGGFMLVIIVVVIIVIAISMIFK